MSIYEYMKTEKCPVCGEMAEAEGVHNGVGYIHPPLHCFNCGWTEENCIGFSSKDCKRCTEYEKCLENEYRKYQEITK